MENKKKVVLAYSGGLDTSVILKWLQEEYNCEVIAFTADIGQGEELNPAKIKAKKLGVNKIYVKDLREEFVKDFVFPMMRCNTLYEGEYLLGTAIARPLIAKHLVQIAKKEKAFAIAHGATGKGNDQVRFELGAYALHPNVKIIAPWREWDLNSRAKLLRYAKKYGIPIENTRKRQSPYSMDANLLHISYEGGILEDPSKAPPEKTLWKWTNSLENTPNKPQMISLSFEKGDLVSMNGQRKKPHELLHALNLLGNKHGVGRLDLVENRFVGLKSRGCYETPGGTILLKAHRALESITLDRELCHLKDELMPKYAKMIYNGFWWSPERLALQELINYSQKTVSGDITLKLFKGNIIVMSRSSKKSLYDKNISTFEDDSGVFNQKDSEGFIKLNALRLKNR
ncbi:MAG: argininosuccinate synthase [Burkholderiaceae bacterium]